MGQAVTFMGQEISAKMWSESVKKEDSVVGG